MNPNGMLPSVPQTPTPSLEKRWISQRRGRILLAIALGVTLLGLLLVSMRAAGLVRPFKLPTSAMAPTINAGDHVMMENVAFHFRNPRRGDIVVFKTAGLAGLPQDQLYLK